VVNLPLRPHTIDIIPEIKTFLKIIIDWRGGAIPQPT
jgi:hypothetical protein